MLDVLTEVKEVEASTRVYLLNCDYFKSGCWNANIKKTPELRAYFAGKPSAVYDRPYTVNGIINWIRKYINTASR